MTGLARWAICLLVAGAAALPATACLTIGVAEGGAYADETVDLVKEIFEQAGQCARILRMPRMRIDLMERSGELDGDAWREESFLADAPFLVKVPTPVQHFRVSLYWRHDFADPASTPGATIGVLMGRGWAREGVQDLRATLFEANSYHQLLQLARTGRIQAFVMPKLTFEKLAATIGKIRPRFNHGNCSPGRCTSPCRNEAAPRFRRWMRRSRLCGPTE